MKIGTKNTNVVESKKTYTPVPKGRYSGTLSFVKAKETKDGTGEYLDATFKITEGDHAGRYIFHKFHIKNKNPKCSEIGMDQLDKYLKCVGDRVGFADSGFDTKKLVDSVNKSVTLNVGIEPAKNGFPERNKVTSFATK